MSRPDLVHHELSLWLAKPPMIPSQIQSSFSSSDEACSRACSYTDIVMHVVNCLCLNTALHHSTHDVVFKINMAACEDL